MGERVDPTNDELRVEKEEFDRRRLEEAEKVYADEDELARAMRTSRTPASPDAPWWQSPGETQSSVMSGMRGTRQYREIFGENLAYHRQRWKDTNTLPVLPQGGAWQVATGFHSWRQSPDVNELAAYEALQEAYRLKSEGKL